MVISLSQTLLNVIRRELIASSCNYPFRIGSIKKYHVNSPGLAKHSSKTQTESNGHNP